MGLFVDTTGSSVTIDELGITLSHPTTNYDIAGQFSAEEVKGAISLTNYITAGTLVWKKTNGGAAQTPGDYDPDFVDIENENLGTGKFTERAVTFKDVKAGTVAFGSFSGTPKIYAVVFTEAYPDANYVVSFTSLADGRVWTVESLTAAGFTINSNANAALTGTVHWQTSRKTQ